MCGIFGVINTNEKIDEGRVLAARDILAHRGPDDAGVYFSPVHPKLSVTLSEVEGRGTKDNGPFIALAHRRLSIIDLSPAAHQPMVSSKALSAESIAISPQSLEQSAERSPFDSAQGEKEATPRYVIVFNGEIYNYKSLIPNPSPKEKGVFKSNSDTEVILNLYAEYGYDCLQYLRGMFAFAIWDDKEKTLFAARDRFGIKPFYYLYNEDQFLFSSELKAIKHYKENLTINYDALDAFLRTGSVPAPLTIYKEVSALLPGSYLEIRSSDSAQCDKLRMTISKYWEFGEMMVDGKWLMDDGKKVLDSRLSVRLAEESKLTDKAGLHGNDSSKENEGHTSSLVSPDESGQAASQRDRRDDNSAISVKAKHSMTEMDSRLSDDKSGLHGNDSSKENEGHTSSLVSARDDALSMTKKYDEDAKNKFPNAVTHAPMHPFIHTLRYDDNAKKVIRNSLLDTIASHLVSDVEVGAFLSGGIDSTAIVSLMRQLGQEKIKTVSVIFPGNKLDESKYALLAAKTYNTEHIEVPFFEQNLIDDFDNIMASMDQPTIDGINTYFVAKAAKLAGLKVVLSGLGGDELFGGYPSFRNIPKYQRIKNLPFAKMFMKAAAPLLKNYLPAKAIHYMKNPCEPNAEYKLVRGLFTDDELSNLGWSCHSDRVTLSGVEGSVISSEARNLKHYTAEDSFSQMDAMAEMTRGAMRSALSALQFVSMMESCFYMRNQLLRDSDVFSMAHSIELRVPFVDHLLYGTVLPYLDDGYDKNFPKKMLVEAVGDIPDEIVHRPKFGFTFPFEDWLRTGKLNNICKELIFGGNLQQYFDKKSLIELFDEFEHGKLKWARIWALMILSKFIKYI